MRLEFFMIFMILVNNIYITHTCQSIGVYEENKQN